MAVGALVLMRRSEKQMPMHETWRSIPGYEGIYEASDLGRIRSIDRSDVNGRVWTGRVLKLALKPNGRLQVCLSKDGVGRTFLVHRLIARTFLGEPAEGMEVCHGDGQPANNHLSNLRWGTSSENKLDAVAHGTHIEAAKTECPRGHLLIVPNLVVAHLVRGQRDCLACSRAHAATRGDRSRLGSTADANYSRLMAATTH